MRKDEVEYQINNKEGAYEDLYYYTQKIKGTFEYLKSKRRNLHAMINQLGLPAFFETFSYAEN